MAITQAKQPTVEAAEGARERKSAVDQPNAVSDRDGWRQVVEGHLPDVIYGANDGIVTTFAVISGVVGAKLSSSVILILGFASVLADGASMGASKYLSERSRHDVPRRAEALRHGGITLLSFILAGGVPLVSYVLPFDARLQFPLACCLTAALLFGLGAGRALFTRRGWLRSGLEMFLVGTGAALLAYLIGGAIAELTGVRALSI